MKWVFCLLLVVVVSSGCSDEDNPTKPLPTEEIWPVNIGNQWTLENLVLDTAGNVLQRDTMVILIARDTVIQGQKWYIVTENGEPGEMMPGQSRSDGMWGWDGDSAILVWKYPAAVGDTCIIGSDTSTVESTSDTVTVPAGTYICVKYKWGAKGEPGRLYQYHFLSPGVGYVLVEEYYRTAGGFEYVRLRSVLLSYLVQ